MVLVDGGLRNEEVLRDAAGAAEVFVLPRLRRPHEEGTEVRASRAGATTARECKRVCEAEGSRRGSGCAVSWPCGGTAHGCL